MNDDKSRSFLSMNVTSGNIHVCKIIRAMDECFEEFGFPKFYQVGPSFLLSFLSFFPLLSLLSILPILSFLLVFSFPFPVHTRASNFLLNWIKPPKPHSSIGWTTEDLEPYEGKVEGDVEEEFQIEVREIWAKFGDQLHSIKLG
jgi:hypothetical protein